MGQPKAQKFGSTQARLSTTLVVSVPAWPIRSAGTRPLPRHGVPAQHGTKNTGTNKPMGCHGGQTGSCRYNPNTYLLNSHVNSSPSHLPASRRRPWFLLCRPQLAPSAPLQRVDSQQPPPAGHSWPPPQLAPSAADSFSSTATRTAPSCSPRAPSPPSRSRRLSMAGGPAREARALRASTTRPNDRPAVPGCLPQHAVLPRHGTKCHHAALCRAASCSCRVVSCRAAWMAPV